MGGYLVIPAGLSLTDWKVEELHLTAIFVPRRALLVGNKITPLARLATVRVCTRERGRTPLLARRRRTSIRQVFSVFFPCFHGTSTLSTRNETLITTRYINNNRDARNGNESRIRFTKTERATEITNRHTFTNDRSQAEAAIYWTHDSNGG